MPLGRILFVASVQGGLRWHLNSGGTGIPVWLGFRGEDPGGRRPAAEDEKSRDPQIVQHSDKGQPSKHKNEAGEIPGRASQQQQKQNIHCKFVVKLGKRGERKMFQKPGPCGGEC